MNEKHPVQVNFSTEPVAGILEFIKETQQGKFTENVPVVTEVTYLRMDIPQFENYFEDASAQPQTENIIFGSVDE